MSLSIDYYMQLFMATFPYWLLSCYPFWNRLRISKKRTILLIFIGEMILFAAIGLCVQMGIPHERAEFLFIPMCLIIDIIVMKIQPSIIFFFFFFIMDYVMMVRGIVFFLMALTNSKAFMSWYDFGLHLLFLIATLPLIFWFLRRTANRMLSVNAPGLWRTFWLVPGFCSFVVLIFTAQQTPDIVGHLKYMSARIALLFCCFVAYTILLNSLETLKNQVLLEQQAQSSASLLRLQIRQYQMQLRQMEEAREARHNLRRRISTFKYRWHSCPHSSLSRTRTFVSFWVTFWKMHLKRKRMFPQTIILLLKYPHL